MNAKKIYKKNYEVLKNFEKKFDGNKKFTKKFSRNSGKKFKNFKKNLHQEKNSLFCVNQEADLKIQSPYLTTPPLITSPGTPGTSFPAPQDQ